MCKKNTNNKMEPKNTDAKTESKTEVKTEVKRVSIAGLIGRFKPLHNGGAIMLDTVCSNFDKVIIGLGSANKYNSRNPFSAAESESMIHAYLSPKFKNYTVIYVPDFAHLPQYKDGKKWKSYLIEKFEELDAFVSGNNYVSDLLSDKYKIVHPSDLIPKEKRVKLRAAEVRLEIARFGPWEDLVPKEVASYLKENSLVERFRTEFGLQTLAELTDSKIKEDESAEMERLHTRET